MDTADENEALRGRVKDLEAALQLGDDAIRITFLMPPRLADILGVLLSKPVVSTEVLERRLDVSDTKVAVYRLRRHLTPYGITVKSQSRVGYWIEPEDKARIKQMIAERVSPEAVKPEAQPARQAAQAEDGLDV